MKNASIVSRLLVAAALTAAVACNSAVAADLVAAKKKVQEVCAACHGLDGISTIADFPKLALAR